MKAREIMTSPVISVGPKTTVAEIARILLENRISAVPVVNDAGRMVGIVSEGDLLRRAESRTERKRSKWLELLLDRNVAAGEFIRTHGREAEDVMTADVISVGPDTETGEIVSLLERHRIKRVPVLENGRVLGIVSRANLLKALVASGAVGGPVPGAATDAEIRQQLTRIVERELNIDLRRVNVIVENGVVTFNGTVKSENQQRALVVAAESVPGVVRVEDATRLDRFPGSTTY